MRTIFISLLLLTDNLFGQDTERIIKEVETPVYSKEIYFVLKEDKKIKHGEYVRYTQRKNIGEKGFYDMNQRTGTWYFYDNKGELEQKYNYSEDKLEFQKPGEFKFRIWTELNGTFTDRLPDELPIFIGGKARQSYLMGIMRYPADARKNGIQGIVYIAAIITKDGQMIDEKIEEGIQHECDEEALRVIKNIPDEWIPAKINGDSTNVKILIPVTFKLG